MISSSYTCILCAPLNIYMKSSYKWNADCVNITNNWTFLYFPRFSWYTAVNIILLTCSKWNHYFDLIYMWATQPEKEDVFFFHFPFCFFFFYSLLIKLNNVTETNIQSLFNRRLSHNNVNFVFIWSNLRRQRYFFLENFIGEIENRHLPNISQKQYYPIY